MVQRAVDIAILLALALAVIATVTGFVAVLGSGYTAGAYVHDLALLILGLAVLTIAESGRVKVKLGNGENKS